MMDMEKTLPTRGQLERQLAQTIQALYRSEFGHLPSKVVCHLFAERVAIVAEDTVTTIEQVLWDNSQQDLAKNIRATIREAFTSQVKQQVADILQVDVEDAICDSTLSSGYLGLIVFLKNAPQVRLAKKERYRSKSTILKQNQQFYSKDSLED